MKFTQNHRSLLSVATVVFSLPRSGRVLAATTAETPATPAMPRRFSWPLGPDVESAGPRISLLARTQRRGRPAEGADGGPLGKRPSAPQGRSLRTANSRSSRRRKKKTPQTDMVFEGTAHGQNARGHGERARRDDLALGRQAGPGTDQAPARPNGASPSQLFNGKDLSGWKLTEPGATGVDGGEWHPRQPRQRPELINDHKFQDFKLHVEFNCGKDSNSGVYLRGRYEVQIETDSVSRTAQPSHRRRLRISRARRRNSRAHPMYGKPSTSL